MTTARPRDEQSVSWPQSFEILRFVAGALAVDSPGANPTLTGKQLQRFFRGRLDEIDPHTVNAIVLALIDRYLVQDPVVIRVMLGEGNRNDALRPIAYALVSHMAAWDQFAAWQQLKYRRAPTSVRRHVLLGNLRFAALEIGIYLGYFAVQAGIDLATLEDPEWNIPIAEDRTLRKLLLRRKMKRDALAAALKMRNPTSVDRWCDQGRRPSDASLVGIAKALAKDEPQQETIRQMLRRHFALRQFVNKLAQVVGWQTTQGLVASVLRFANGTHAYLHSTRVQPGFRPLICNMVLGLWMMWAPSPALLSYLSEHETDSRWRGTIRGLQFASRCAVHDTSTRADGPAAFVVRYPRMALLTDFDAITSDLFVDGGTSE